MSFRLYIQVNRAVSASRFDILSVHSPSSNQPTSATLLKLMELAQVPNFDCYANRVDKLLRIHSASSAEVRAAFHDLQTFFPLPPSEIVGPEKWRTTTAQLRVNTHLKSDFADALRNIKDTGRELTAADEEWLRLILTHWSGWSATDSMHMRDPWVRYLQALFGHLRGLVPILDSLVWPEELAHFPVSYTPIEPSLFLLATPEAYYVFDLDGLGLYCAGNSLEEVYFGLRESRFNGDKEGDWLPEKWCSLNLDARFYFPVYEFTSNSDLSFNLRHPLREFPTDRTNRAEEGEDKHV